MNELYPTRETGPREFTTFAELDAFLGIVPGIPCQNCGTHFIAKRKTAKYCSTKCRTSAHRKS